MRNRIINTARNLPGNSNIENQNIIQRILPDCLEEIDNLIRTSPRKYISIISIDLKIIYASPSFYNLGYESDSLINRSIFNCISSNDAEALNLLFTDYEKKGDSSDFSIEYNRFLQCSLKTKSEDWIDAEINVNILPDESSNPFAFLLIFSETESGDLSYSELREWTDTFDTFVAKFDINGFMLFCNASFLKLGGIKESDVYGKYFPDTKLLSHSKIERAKIIKCLNNSKAFLSSRIECTFLGADHNPVPAIFNCQPVMDNYGNIKYITGEGKTIIDEMQLRRKLIETNENLEKRVRERTGEITEINEKIKNEILVRKKVEKALRKSKERFRDITYSIADVIWEVDKDGNYTYCSENVYDLYGYKSEEIIGNTPKKLLHPEYRLVWEKYLGKKIKKKDSIKDIECICFTKDGQKVHILVNGIPMLNKDGEVVGFRGVDKDITMRKLAEEENKRLAAFPRESPHPILSSDSEGYIIYKNPAAQSILEYFGINSPDSILPDNHKELIRSCLEEKKSCHNIEVRINDHVFSWTYNPIADINLVHLHGLDITEQKYFEEKLLHDALHDSLTGLPNRAFFHDELLRSIKISQRRNNYRFAVLFMDLGRFKLINDSLGHIIGDKVLAEVAKRLSSCLRPEDTAARFGGDEFTILLNNIDDLTDPIRVTERIQKKLSMSMKIEEHEIFPTASIGIALSTGEYEQPEDLLRDANTAMYHAKAQGLSKHMIFDKAMHRQAIKQFELENNLQYAIERKEFAIYYQPIISIESGKIVGFEALLRWLHPKRGIIMPDEFVPMLEETGQIIPIGEWILRKACSQLRYWHKKFPEKQNLYVSVNMSAKQFARFDIIDKISQILHDENLYPGYLNLEITESVIMENHEKMNSMLLKLRDMDVQLGIDDFGIGYSSLSNLHRFPIQILKIDRSFIKIMNDKNGTSVIPHTIITLGRHLEMDVIAEGVETAEQFKRLIDLECAYAQGYYFSPPVDSKKAELLIKNDPEWK